MDFWTHRANQILYNLIAHTHTLKRLFDFRIFCCCCCYALIVIIFHSLYVLCIWRVVCVQFKSEKNWQIMIIIVIWAFSRLIDFIVVFFIYRNSPAIYKLIKSTKWRGKSLWRVHYVNTRNELKVQCTHEPPHNHSLTIVCVCFFLFL